MFSDVGASPVRSDAALPIGSSSALVPALDFICFERDSDSAVAMRVAFLACYGEREFIALAARNSAPGKTKPDISRTDFERRKAAVLDRYPSTPVEALAAFLCCVSRQNVHEGRNATIITDTLKCGVVANLLGFEMKTLEDALVDLKGQGLIQERSNGQLIILDLERLEHLGDGAAG